MFFRRSSGVFQGFQVFLLSFCKNWKMSVNVSSGSLCVLQAPSQSILRFCQVYLKCPLFVICFPCSSRVYFFPMSKLCVPSNILLVFLQVYGTSACYSFFSVIFSFCALQVFLIYSSCVLQLLFRGSSSVL